MKRVLIALSVGLLASAAALAPADAEPRRAVAAHETAHEVSSVSCPICGGNPDDYIALVHATTNRLAAILLAVLRF